MIVLKSPLSLIRAILGVTWIAYLRILLILLIGSLYLSVIGFVIWGAFWISRNFDVYLGWIIGTFFVSVITLTVAIIFMTVLGRMQSNDNPTVSTTDSTA